MTPSGIEPATFWLVAQCLTQLRHHVRFVSSHYSDLAFGAADLFRIPVSVNRLFLLMYFSGLIQDYILGPCCVFYWILSERNHCVYFVDKSLIVWLWESWLLTIGNVPSDNICYIILSLVEFWLVAGTLRRCCLYLLLNMVGCWPVRHPVNIFHEFIDISRIVATTLTL